MHNVNDYTDSHVGMLKEEVWPEIQYLGGKNKWWSQQDGTNEITNFLDSWAGELSKMGIVLVWPFSTYKKSHFIE